MPPPVTAVIPLYNKAGYIERTLSSIQAQTYPHWQVIVVDDGSTDGGPDRVQGCAAADGRIQLIQQPNAGPGAARNRGLVAGITPLVAFLDADDEWMPTFLAKAVKALEQHPSCALWVCGQRRGKAGTPWSQGNQTEGLWRLPFDLPTQALKPTLDRLHSGAIVARRQIIAELGGFYAKDHCTYGEDIYLWLQVALAHPLYCTAEPLAWYHLEASEIGVWHRQALPPWPMVLDAQPLRDRCPPDYRPLLERYLAYYALLSARRLAATHQGGAAWRLLREYPRSLGFGSLSLKALWHIVASGFR
jgi:glycosyltransferase involved in cell wall biosynthesis